MSGVEIKNIEGITSQNNYSNGQMETCRVNMPNVISTPYGELVPRYSPPGIREKEMKSISFYNSGMVRAIVLEEQTDVSTPLGIFPAELITFYEDGSLDSVFPLNGQIGFGWSEEEEKALAKDVTFDFPIGFFETKPIGLRFYPSGDFKSLILWPNEVINIKTPVGMVPTRIGFNLYESGNVQSVEPAFPISVPTPIGNVDTYDTVAVGVDASVNSLRFNEDGDVIHLVTSGDIIVKNNKTGSRHLFGSRTRLGLTDETEIKLPIRLQFHDNMVTIDDGQKKEDFIIEDCEFLVLSDYSSFTSGCSGGSIGDDCGGCTMC